MLTRLACLLALWLMGCSGEVAAPVGKSDVPLEEIDLGDVTLSPEGLRFAVEVRNVGGTPLKITNVALSCGCTTTEQFDALIPAGARRSIPLRVRPTSAGPGSSSVRVSTDETPARTHRIMIQWNASAEIEPDPLRVSFGNVKPGSRHEGAVTLRINSPRASVSSWECTPTHRLTVNPDGNAVTVELAAGDEIGSFTGMLIGTAEGAWPKTIRIPIEWSVHQSVEAMPPRLFLGNVRPGEVVTRTLVVASPLGEAFEVSGVTCRGFAGLETRPRKRRETGQQIEVMWTAPAAPGPCSGTIELAVRGTDHDTVMVPVSGYVTETAGAIAGRVEE